MRKIMIFLAVLALADSSGVAAASNAFDLQSFYGNPFEQTIYVPKVLAKSLTELVQGHENDLKVLEERVSNQEYTNGYYVRTTITSPHYRAIYISPWSKDSYLRNNLVISKKDERLKFNLKIGMKISEVLKIIHNSSPQHFQTDNFESYYVSGDELQVHFVVRNGLLSSVEIQVGD